MIWTRKLQTSQQGGKDVYDSRQPQDLRLTGMLFVALRQGLQLLVAAHIVTTWSGQARSVLQVKVSAQPDTEGGAMAHTSLER